MVRLLGFLFVLSTLGACAQSTEGSSSTTSGTTQVNLDVNQVSELLKSDKEVVLIDVRTPEEYKQGHLEGSDLLNFYDPKFKEEVAKLDKSKEYVIYCRSGGRSGSAVAQMQKMGFENVHNMKGGILAWNRANLPTQK